VQISGFYHIHNNITEDMSGKHKDTLDTFRYQELVLLDDTDKDDDRLLLTSSSASSSPLSSSSSPTILAKENRPLTFLSTSWDVLSLSLPLAVSRLSWTFMKTTDTALIGHTGTLYLSASAVADLYTQSTGVFVTGGILGTLVAQAYGSTNKLMGGIWLEISLFVIACISVPIIISWLLCGPMLKLIGVKEELIPAAAYYAYVLVTAMPARIIISQLSQYLMAQGIVQPLVKTGLFSMILNLILGIILVLGFGIPGWEGYGFWVCPIVTVIVEWMTLFIYLYWFCYKQQLHKQGNCWPDGGCQWGHITLPRLREFSALYLPATLAAASDWWRVSAIGVVAVSFHDDASLAVFNSAYRVTWMSLIVIGATGSAMGVLIGQELGKQEPLRAQKIALSTIIMAFGLVLMFGAIFYSIPDKVAMIFSSDPEVIAMYEHVALPLTGTLIAMNFSVLLERIPLSCARMQAVLWTGVVGSWAAQVPAVLICTTYYRNDLYGLFTGVAVGYAVLDCLLIGVVFTTDWAFYADEACKRNEAISVVSAVEEDSTDANSFNDQLVVGVKPCNLTETETETEENDDNYI
jgi:MATE family multidrug resistance protein